MHTFYLGVSISALFPEEKEHYSDEVQVQTIHEFNSMYSKLKTISDDFEKVFGVPSTIKIEVIHDKEISHDQNLRYQNVVKQWRVIQENNIFIDEFSCDQKN